jgi:hypothetical protein
MTPDERKMLSDLADRIAQTPAPPKDPEAEDFIRKRIGSRPDALYLMTQTVLIQNLALQHAQEQIQQLQRGAQPGAASPGGSFLGQQTAPRTSGPAYSTPPAGQQQYSAPPPPQYSPPSPAGPSPSGAPSFLRGAAQTAAGVAAGALAFEGIQALFSHPGYGGGGLGGFGGAGFAGGGAPGGETIVNNYYDTPGGDQLGQGNDVYAPDDTRNLDNTSNLQDVSDVNDSSQLDDSGQYDDATDFGDGGGGGFDDGGGGDSFA